MKIIIAVFIFCFIVFFHELGHFIMAKLNNIRVEELSLGFGPKLLHFKKGETDYCIKLIPFGGSCIMGEDDGDSDDPRAFVNASVGARMAVILGGPAFNLLLAFLLAIVLVAMSGYDLPNVTEVREGYPAQAAGIEPGDTIVKIDSHRTHFFRDVSLYIAMKDGEKMDVTYERNGVRNTVTVVPVYDEEDERYYIGLSGGTYARGNLFDIIEHSAYEVEYWVYITFKSIQMLVTGNVGMGELTGPVGIVNTVGDTYDTAKAFGFLVIFINMVNIAVLLTANLGIMNLLPFPGLDGGRFILLVVEAIRGKKANPNTEAAINGAGMALLFVLMIFVMFNDVRKLFM